MPDDFPDIPMDPDPAEDFPDLAAEIEQTENITDSDGQSLDALDQDQDAIELESRVEDIEERLNGIPSADFEPSLFPAQIGTDGSWGETTVVAGSWSLVGNATSSDWRHFVGNDTLSGAGLIPPSLGMALVLAVEDTGTGGAFTRFTSIVNVRRFCDIVSVSATINATTWTLLIRFWDDNSTANAFNLPEWKNNGTSSGAIMGNPGSLGIFVGTDGKTDGGCQISPPGPQSTEAVSDPYNGVWWVKLPNSAE